MKMSVWGLMTITAVMRNLSALSTSGSGLNMKFCFLNQGCRSKNIVLKPFNMVNDRDDIVSLTWTYQCLGWRWPRPPRCWRSGHSSSPRSTSRWGGAGRCRGCRRASRDYPRDSWQRGTPPDPLEEDQMSVTLTITPVTPDIARYLAWCHSDDWTPLPPWPTPAWRWAPPWCCWSPGCSPWRRNSSVFRHTETRKRLYKRKDDICAWADHFVPTLSTLSPLPMFGDWAPCSPIRPVTMQCPQSDNLNVNIQEARCQSVPAGELSLNFENLTSSLK